MSIIEKYEGGANLPFNKGELLAQKIDTLEMKILSAEGEEKEKLEAEKAEVEKQLAEMGIEREAA